MCVCVMLGCAACQFSSAGFSFWCPTYMVEDLNMTRQEAGLELGAVTSVSSLIGAILGGVLLDELICRTEKALAEQYQVPDQYLRCAIAVKLCAVCGAIAAASAFIGLHLFDPIAFLSMLFIVLGTVCIMQAPVNIALMEAVAPDHRGMAMALNNTIMHLLGDLFSPSLIGAIKDSSDMTTALVFAAAWLLWSPVLYGAASGLLMCKRRRLAQVLSLQST